MQNIECFFENNALHDYEISQINIDYPNGLIIINLYTDRHEAIEIIINKFSSITFSKNEPWGKGTYIASSNVEKINDEFILELQLNSGDTCTIVFGSN